MRGGAGGGERKAAEAAADDSKATYIQSPMVGTFYSAANPESPAFAKVGDQVGPETTVCIIEAMKVFNEIPAECTRQDRGRIGQERRRDRIQSAAIPRRGRVIPELRVEGFGLRDSPNASTLNIRLSTILMYQRILVANRGEIALRVIRACRELGVETVAIYSEGDRGSRYLELADEAFCVGPAKASESYLKISSVISAAEVGNVQAIHPGYGFLAENAHFNEICRSCNIDFIGPTPEAMAQLGDKNAARDLARQSGVPVVPGSEGLDNERSGRTEVCARSWLSRC